MNPDELSESSRDQPSPQLQIGWGLLITAMLGTVAILILDSVAVATLFGHPSAELLVGGKFVLPAEAAAVIGTALVIAGTATCVRLPLRTLPIERQRYLWSISIFGSSAAVFTLISITALIWATDSGPILRITGNFAWVSVLLFLYVVRIRSIDLSA